MFVFDGSGVTGRRALVSVVISALVMGAGIAVWWLPPPGKAPSTPSTGGRRFGCVAVAGDPAQQARALEICRRQVADDARRAPRPSQEPMDPQVMRIYSALSTAFCQTGTTGACDRPWPATEADVTAVRRVLTGLGYPDAVVRLQRPGDPAPDASVVYAVRLPGDRCVVAFVAMGSGPNINGISGLLPTGECLPA